MPEITCSLAASDLALAITLFWHPPITPKLHEESMLKHRIATKRPPNGAKKARLYHLSEETIKQIDVLAALYGGKEAAVAGAIDATYRAAGVALQRLKVRINLPTKR